MLQDQERDAPTISSRTPGLRLDSGIRQRGEEMYLSGPNPSKPKDVGRGKSTLESALSVLGAVGNPFNWNNPAEIAKGVVTGVMQHERIRADKIAELAGNKAFLEGYKPGSNTYSNLDFLTRNLYNIKPDDITSQRIHDRNYQLQNNPGYQALEAEFREDPDLKGLFPKGSLTTVADIDAAVNTLNSRNEILSALNNSTMGPGLLAEARAANPGRRLTNSELRQLQSKATTTDPVYIEQRNAAKDQSKLTQSNIDTNKSTAKVNEGTLALAQTKERNANTLANSNIEFGNKKLDYEWRAAQEERELRKTLTMLGFDNKRDERRERLEEREAERRQLFILQLMKGLGSLGQSIGGSL